MKGSSNLTPPKQYAQGWTEFYKLKFKLTRDVLIPRPETELLVDEVLHLSSSMPVISIRPAGEKSADYSPVDLSSQVPRDDKKKPQNDKVTVLDLGTGSGCIAISVAKNAPNIKILATDVSKEALEIAELNAKFHKVLDKIIFLESDLLSAFQPRVVNPDPSQKTSDRGVNGMKSSPGNPDIIVTNLPYIPTARLMYIDPMVTEFEPRVALDGGTDGFELYRKLLDQMKEKKIIPKYLIGEIDYTHGELAPLEVNRRFPQASADVKTDLAHKQRILLVKF